MQKLTQEQKAALALTGGICCLIAGPGSGKTAVLTRRIHQDRATTDEDSMVVVTFTNAAAGELRERLAALGPVEEFRHIGTLHSWAAKELRKTGKLREIATEKQINEVTKSVKKTLGAMARNMSGAEIWRNAVEPPKYGNGKSVGMAVRSQMAILGLTHHDLILTDFLTLVEAGTVEAPDTIYVDEYQDSAPVDARIYRSLHGMGTALFFIGDPRQSIYGFRGARPENLQDVWQVAKSKGQLTANFRSRPTICQLVTRIGMKMEGMEFDPTVEAVNTDLEGNALLEKHLCEHDEMTSASEWAARQTQLGRSAAILTRYNSQASAVAAVLRGKGMKVECSADQFRESFRQTLGEAVERIQAAGITARTEPGWRNQMIALGIMGGLQDALMPRLLTITTQDELISLGEAVEGTRATTGANTITVGTIHAAKGLEWDSVFILGADGAAFPFANPEAGRLVFVGCSRAREHLTVSHATTRTQPESGKLIENLERTPWI